MLLTAQDMRRLIKAGVTAEAFAILQEISERNATGATAPATEVQLPHATSRQRRGPLHKGLSSTERSRIYREKRKAAATDKPVAATAEPVAEPLHATVVSPTPLSLPSVILVPKEVLKKESKGVVVARETKRATRLPPDFEPDETSMRLARELGFTKGDWKECNENFKDYWAGAVKGTKIDWNATHRNALRNWKRNGKGNGNGNYKTNNRPPTREEGFAQVRAVIAEAERRELEDSRALGEEDALLLPGLSEISS